MEFRASHILVKDQRKAEELYERARKVRASSLLPTSIPPVQVRRSVGIWDGLVKVRWFRPLRML